MESIKTGDQAGNDLKYTKLSLAGFPERIENCDGVGSDTPGTDCSGPKYTLNLAPIQDGAPLYFSVPYFDSKAMLATDPSKKNNKYGGNSYDPADRVAITKCKGHEWCTEHEYDTVVKVEPNTGFTFHLQAGAQMNIRIGSMPSTLYPKMTDATIPVWANVEGITPPDKVLGDLYGLQSAPESLAGLIGLFYIVGAVCFALALVCIGIIFYRQKKRKSNDVKSVVCN